MAVHCKIQGHSNESCAKTAEPIEMPFGVNTRVGRKNLVSEGSRSPTGTDILKGCPIVRPIGNHCSSELSNNGWTLTFAQNTDRKLLHFPVYRCSWLGDQYLHLREISDFKLWFFLFHQQGATATATASRFNQRQRAFDMMPKNSTRYNGAANMDARIV